MAEWLKALAVLAEDQISVLIPTHRDSEPPVTPGSRDPISFTDNLCPWSWSGDHSLQNRQ